MSLLLFYRVVSAEPEPEPLAAAPGVVTIIVGPAGVGDQPFHGIKHRAS